MKKKSLIIAIVAILVVGAAVAGYFVFKGRSGANAQAKPMNDTIALYINVDQLATKSAINSVITNANRNLIATVLTSEMEDAESTEYVKSLLSNLANTGIDTKKPIYGYSNPKGDSYDVEFDLTIVAEVADVKKVDRLFDFAFEVAGFELDVERKGDKRILELDDDCVVGYNDSRFIITITSDDSAKKALNKAFDRETPNLAAYSKYDIAYSANLKKAIKLLKSGIEASIDEQVEYLGMCEYEYEEEWIADSIESLQQQLDALEQVDKSFEKDSNLIMGITFEKGRVVAESIVNGYNSEYKLDSKVDNTYLENVSKDAIIVANYAINGPAISEAISNINAAEYAGMLNIDRGELNLYMGILSDAIKSINGDVTLALESINGNAYYGPKSVDALMAISVDDDYIISNVAQFGEGFLEKRGKNTYGVEFDEWDLTIGQKDKALYLTANNSFKKHSPSALKSSWYADVKNSYGYFVVDIENLMNDSFVSSCYRSFMRQMDEPFADAVDTFIDSCNYGYLTINTPNSAQMVLVFDDQNTNALEQIVRQVVPAIVRTATYDMF
jgi:hypothetical protein